MTNSPWRERFRYAFDNLLSRGSIALLGWLIVIGAVVVLSVSLITWETGYASQPTLADQIWTFLVTTLISWDPTEGLPWPTRVSMLILILFNLFTVSIIIGVIVAGIEGKLYQLRRGRSQVLESDHIVILGWSTQVFPILSELLLIDDERIPVTVVILGDKDKVEMEEEVRTRIRKNRRIRVICRQGVATDLIDLKITNLDRAKSIIILPPEQNSNPDTSVIKTLLALSNNPERRSDPYRIVTEIQNPKNLQIAETVGKDRVEFVLTGDFIARVIAQICRQPGLSRVYLELLSFAGNEIYFDPVTTLAGETFSESIFAYENAIVIGYCPENGDPCLKPSPHTTLKEGDQMIVIANNYRHIKFWENRERIKFSEQSLSDKTVGKKPEKFLILGWNEQAETIIQKLDAYVCFGSVATVIADESTIAQETNPKLQRLEHLSVLFQTGDITDRQLLNRLPLQVIDHIILLAYSDHLDAEEADGITLTSLLHLRQIAKEGGYHFSITSEMMDSRNQQLATIAQVDDFIVSDRLTSLMISQIAENPLCSDVINELLEPNGCEIYLKPISNYIQLQEPVSFYTLMKAAQKKQEIAIGYRCSHAGTQEFQGYGIVLNPPKLKPIRFSERDRLIVIGENF
ncbi:MAG: potassium transporter [Halothece sp. Uz-M2-17]|nr:potassium transporter [Halothece sp. Uz-M2-17]